VRFSFRLISSFILFIYLILPASLALGRATPRVRVLVAENQKTLFVTIKGHYTLRALPGLQVIRQGERAIRVPIIPSSKGIQMGKEVWAVKGIRIEPARDRDLFLGKSRFRGHLDVIKTSDGFLIAVNNLDVESYLYGVLHHEVAPWWPMEALKAQAIAARTYALYERLLNKSRDYDLKSTTSSQVYGGSTNERYRTRRAVDETAGKVLAFQGKIFPAYFHATCAGTTAAASELWKISLPPLGGKVLCGYCRMSPHYSWETKVALSDIEETLTSRGRGVGRILSITPISQTPSGRVGSIRLIGTGGETVMAAKDFRIWVGGNRVRSTSFSISLKEDAAIFRGKGWGHGVGLCQWGSLGQALLGRDAKKILNVYYPGSEVTDFDADLKPYVGSGP
jgi:stage II sporulation protein D